MVADPLQKYPASHAPSQAAVVLPGDDANLPAGQELHTDNPVVEYCPLGHMYMSARVEPAGQ